MNLSGISVQALVREFDADATRDLIVIYDEIALAWARCASGSGVAPVAITGSSPSPARWARKSGCGFVSGSLPRAMRQRRAHGGDGRITC